jgi:hypothetical protein
MIMREGKRSIDAVIKRLHRMGAVSLRYNEKGEKVWTATLETAFTEAEGNRVHEAFIAAGPDGMTLKEAAEKTGLSLIKVRCIIGDFESVAE